MNTHAYERITERITELLERGKVPWRMTWKVRTGLPRNAISKKPYRGVNMFLLLAMEYESPLWLTYRQALKLGGTVRKGEKACPVVFWKRKTLKEKNSGEERKIALLRIYNVFNVTQCDGISDAPTPTDMVAAAAIKPVEVVLNMPQCPLIKNGMASAFYSTREDVVGMPAKERFEHEETYFATLFHELVHSTGHESRLKRASLLENTGYGSDPYCKEELVAEMGAAFLCGHAEIVERTINNSAAYLGGWLAALKGDKTLIVQAAAQAQRAADFILGKNPTESVVESEVTPKSSEPAADSRSRALVCVH